jgi:chemotaxis protein CheD
MTKDKPKEIAVNMGEIKCSSKPAIFSCSGIGSCVVLFLYEPNSAIGGVAHIMLPDFSQAGPGGNKGLYADTSPKLLIGKLLASGANPSRLKAKIVGGANLFDWASSSEMAALGRNNIQMVKQELLRHKIYLAAEEVGGYAYKTARFNSVTGYVTIKLDSEQHKII